MTLNHDYVTISIYNPSCWQPEPARPSLNSPRSHSIGNLLYMTSRPNPGDIPRHYGAAIECLIECWPLSEQRQPIVQFSWAQLLHLHFIQSTSFYFSPQAWRRHSDLPALPTGLLFRTQKRAGGCLPGEPCLLLEDCRFCRISVGPCS